jgi:hypothetical protein
MALAAFLRPAPGSSLPLPHLPACSPKEKELNRSPQRRRGNHDSRFRRGATVLFHAEDAEERRGKKKLNPKLCVTQRPLREGSSRKHAKLYVTGAKNTKVLNIRSPLNSSLRSLRPSVQISGISFFNYTFC